jgi:hypothetical protein
MPEDLHGGSMYERAIELVSQGTLVAIVPVEDGDKIGLYALTQDLEQSKIVKRAALSPQIGNRAACAIGLIFRTRQAVIERGMTLRDLRADL